MPAYVVDFMDGDEVTSTITIAASTPIRAASKAAGRQVDLEVNRRKWLRVISPGRHAFEFGYVDS